MQKSINHSRKKLTIPVIIERDFFFLPLLNMRAYFMTGAGIVKISRLIFFFFPYKLIIM